MEHLQSLLTSYMLQYPSECLHFSNVTGTKQVYGYTAFYTFKQDQKCT